LASGAEHDRDLMAPSNCRLLAELRRRNVQMRPLHRVTDAMGFQSDDDDDDNADDTGDSGASINSDLFTTNGSDKKYKLINSKQHTQ